MIERTNKLILRWAFYEKLCTNFKPIYFHNSTMSKPQIFQITPTKPIHL